jgi:predicted dithiol-disulfide oxidoreductase (DUF899 family)
MFAKNEINEIFHTYSWYGRGTELLNGAFQYLDFCRKAATGTSSTLR